MRLTKLPKAPTGVVTSPREVLVSSKVLNTALVSRPYVTPLIGAGSNQHPGLPPHLTPLIGAGSNQHPSLPTPWCSHFTLIFMLSPSLYSLTIDKKLMSFENKFWRRGISNRWIISVAQDVASTLSFNTLSCDTPG